jgi:hypothetical protein
MRAEAEKSKMGLVLTATAAELPSMSVSKCACLTGGHTWHRTTGGHLLAGKSTVASRREDARECIDSRPRSGPAIRERWPRLFRQFPGFAKWNSAGLMSK